MDSSSDSDKRPVWLRILLLLIFLYLFLLSIELLGHSFKSLGRGFAETLLQTTANPVAGLLIGILATSIIQSSSATTSIVVGMVAAGTLTVRHAIPIVMGANIGTTVTNTIVSLGHFTRPVEFRRAFSGAVVHDIFNLLSVAVFLPLEVWTHYLEHSATFLQKIFSGVGGFKATSPLKIVVKPLVHIIFEFFHGLIGSGVFLGVVLLVVALIILFLSLARLVNLMKSLIIGKVEVMLHNYLFVTPIRSLLLGLVITAIIQSSSVVTSLAIPLLGAGILSVEQIFPYTLGANIGTTFTAILASLVTQRPAAITIAFVHLLFNISGTLLWYPLRKVPISAAKWLGEVVYRRRWVAIVYVVIIFFAIPIFLIYIT